MMDCIFTGDVMPGARKIQDAPPSQLLEKLAGADIVVGNLESPLARKAPARRNLDKIPLWSTVENIDTLKAFRFSHFCLNNNHIFDLYESGLADTRTLLDQAGICCFGLNYDGISQFEIVEKNGIRLGLVAFSWVQAQFSRHLFQDEKKIDLKKAKASVDFLVCCIHWGDDHNLFVNRDQQESARRLIDQGVDLVIGSHPHVPQGWETYHGKYIFYSLGNFLFTPREHYDHLPYRIRYDDQRENVLFQREECKIGLYVNVRFSKAGYNVTNVAPVYRRHTLPGELPERLNGHYTRMQRRMNAQIADADYRLNEAYKKMILTRYTLPLIFKHPVYWPILIKKMSLKKACQFIANRQTA